MKREAMLRAVSTGSDASFHSQKLRVQTMDPDVVATYGFLVRVLRKIAVLPTPSKDRRRRREESFQAVRLVPVLLMLLMVLNALWRQDVWRVERPQAEIIPNMFVGLDSLTVFSYASLLYLFRPNNAMLFRQLVSKLAVLQLADRRLLNPHRVRQQLIAFLVPSGLFIVCWTGVLFYTGVSLMGKASWVAVAFYMTRFLDLPLSLAFIMLPWCMTTYLQFHKAYASTIATEVGRRRDVTKLLRRGAGRKSNASSVEGPQSPSRVSPSRSHRDSSVMLLDNAAFQAWLLTSKQELGGFLDKARANTSVLIYGTGASYVASCYLVYEAMLAVTSDENVVLAEAYWGAGAIFVVGVVAAFFVIVQALRAMRTASSEFHQQFDGVIDSVDGDEELDELDHDGSDMEGGTTSVDIPARPSHSQRVEVGG